MKNIILSYLLLTTLSLITATEFGKEISFDMNNNNEFEFIFEQNGNLFIRIDFPKSDLLTLNIQSYDASVSESSLISAPGKTTVIPFKQGYSIKIKLSYKSSSNEKGTIWMNPSISEIKVDLNKKYEWKYDYKEYRSHTIIYPLIYSIDNAEKDAIIVFKFNDKLHIHGDYIALNPLSIFNGNYSKIGGNYFKIEKGKSYKIKASIPYWYLKKNSYIHFLPSFSFHFIEKEPEKVQLFEFGKHIPFDMNNNNEFEFIFEQDGNLFLQVDFPKSDLLTLNIQSYDTLELATSISESSLISPPGKATSIPFKKGYSIKIKLSYKSSSNEKGTIWMNPSTSEIKIDLNKKYEWKYDYKEYRVHNVNFPLIYSIDNAEKAVILVFKFNENLHIYGDYIALNPVTIYNENFNMPNITNFKIEKVESYKIRASMPYWYLNNLKYTFFTFFFIKFCRKSSRK